MELKSIKQKKPIVLVILDGWGEWDIEKGNPSTKAKLPTIERLDKSFPKILIQTSGMSVGLPWGVRGNSEVGHQTIGSGQIVFQFLPAIYSAIGDGSFFKNEIILNHLSYIKKSGASLHLFGLLSDGGVHSHIDHLFALLEMAKKEDIKKVFIHVVADGRDTHPQSVEKFLESLQRKISEIGIGSIATICGRHYAMDRNNNWDRIERAFLAMVGQEGIKEKDPIQAVENQYKRKITDEYLEPVILVDDSNDPVGAIEEEDVVICFNFRKDRSRQITKAFVVKDFKEFKKAQRLQNIKFICFAEYEKGLPVEVIFKIKEITTRLGEILSQNNKIQLRISETEKYAHVTYFFNGGLEEPFPGEERILIQSKKVNSYAEIPEMSSKEITDKILEVIESEQHDFMLINFPNADMVGHTGNFKAAVWALENVDACLERLVNGVLRKGGELIITADHGNVEEMINIYTGEIDTQHSKNPVPCWYVSNESYNKEIVRQIKKREIEGMLIDIAPTILELMNIPKPKDMIGISLLNKFMSKK